MPLPEKRSSEKDEEFIQRCMSNRDVKKEFSFEQAQAFCLEQVEGGGENKSKEDNE